VGTTTAESAEFLFKERPSESFSGGGVPTLRLLGTDGELSDGHGRFFGPGGAEKQYHDSFLNFARLQYELAGQEHVTSPFSENVFVRAAVKAFASGIARLSFGMWSDDPTKADAKLVDEHPLMSLIRRPNKRQTERQLWQAHTRSMKLDGESYWFLAGPSGGPLPGSDRTGVLTRVPKQIIQVSGSKVKMERGPDGWPKNYRYTVGKGSTKGESQKFPWYSVIPFLDGDPEDQTRGLGDAEAAIRPIDIQHQIMRYIDASLRNGGAPSGMLIFEEALAPSELERRQEEVDDEFRVENAGRVKVVDRGAKFVPSSFTPKDFEYEKLWKGMTSAILTAMGTPEPVVGIFENATYENVRTAFLEFWRGTNGVIALGTQTSDVITNLMLPRLAGVWRGSKAVAHFDHSQIEVLQEDYISELTLAREIAQSGVGISFNEALEMLGTKVGLKESGDKHWAGQGMTDMDTGETYGQAPAQPEGSEDKEPGDKKKTVQQMLALLKKIEAEAKSE